MKPYPWKCGKCDTCAVTPAVLDYEATFEHDGRPYNFVVPALSILRCQQCGVITLDDAANRAISAAFRKHAGLLTPTEIRKRRSELGLSQPQLARFLDVSVSTLSRWETGGQIQQRAMDKLLRGFFTVREFRHWLGYREPTEATEDIRAVGASASLSITLSQPTVAPARNLAVVRGG